MTRETFEKAVSIHDELTIYRKVRDLVNKGTVYMADADTVYHNALPDDLLSCIEEKNRPQSDTNTMDAKLNIQARCLPISKTIPYQKHSSLMT